MRECHAGNTCTQRMCNISTRSRCVYTAFLESYIQATCLLVHPKGHPKQYMMSPTYPPKPPHTLTLTYHSHNKALTRKIPTPLPPPHPHTCPPTHTHSNRAHHPGHIHRVRCDGDRVELAMLARSGHTQEGGRGSFPQIRNDRDWAEGTLLP